MTAILSIMLSAGCVSQRVVEKTVVPELVFPLFPLADNMSDNNDGTVTVSSEWIVRLMEYKIRIEETEQNYTDIKMLYKED